MSDKPTDILICDIQSLVKKGPEIAAILVKEDRWPAYKAERAQQKNGGQSVKQAHGSSAGGGIVHATLAMVLQKTAEMKAAGLEEHQTYKSYMTAGQMILAEMKCPGLLVKGRDKEGAPITVAPEVEERLSGVSPRSVAVRAAATAHA